MKINTQQNLKLQSVNRKNLEINFNGGNISSNAGVVLLRQADKKLNLTRRINKIIKDPRKKDNITHSQLSLLQQRIYSVAAGFEDLNDHNDLRNDQALQTSVGREETLASSSTLCRLENRISRKEIIAMHEIMIDVFIESFDKAPKELILDFDATDDKIHGDQEGKYYNGYYQSYCFLPLYVFCKDQLLVSYLRPCNQDAAKHSWGILSLLVKRLRKEWPNVKITFRGDSGFCRHKMFNWCEKQKDVYYLTGIARNDVLERKGGKHMEEAVLRYEETKEKQRLFTEFSYKAGSWKRDRRVIAKSEVTDKGKNPRYIVTNMEGDAQYLYDEVYCKRGDMENRIKEQQLCLFADRTSAHEWWANQFRVMISSLSYILTERIRSLGLTGTKLSKAYVSTIRERLFKIGGLIVINSRRIVFHLSSSYNYQDIFLKVVKRLALN